MYCESTTGMYLAFELATLAITIELPGSTISVHIWLLSSATIRMDHSVLLATLLAQASKQTRFSAAHGWTTQHGYMSVLENGGLVLP